MKTYSGILPDGTRWEIDGPEGMSERAAMDEWLRQRTRGEPTKEGAPYRVRAVVGAAQEPEDRLETLRQWYPDASPYGKDNFVYTDQDGQRTLYNPEGFDLGDIPSIGPELSELAGGTVGAVLGAAGGPAGILAGAGSGAMLAKDLYTTGMEKFSGTVDSRSLPAQAMDSAQTALVNAAGEGAGRLVGQGAEALTRRAVSNPQGRAALQTAEELGIDTRGLSAEIGGTPLVRGTANVLSGTTPSSINTMGRAKERAIGDYTDRMAGMHENVEPGMAGLALRQGQEQAADAFRVRERELRQAMTQAAEDVVVGPQDLAKTRELLARWTSEMDRNPTAAGHLATAADEAAGLLDDAAGGIPYATLRERMTYLTQLLKSPQAGTGYVGKAGQGLKRLERALRDDAREAVSKQRPEARPLVDEYDAYVSRFLAPDTSGKSPAGMLEAMGRAETDRLSAWALSGSKNGAERLKNLRDIMPADQWETFKQSTLKQMGMQPGGTSDFSVARFVTQWRNMDDAARKTLFGDDYDVLSRMAELGESIKEVEQAANTSRTARDMVLAQTIAGAGGAGPGILAGDPVLAAGGFAGTTLAPWMLAQGLTSPGFSSFVRGGSVPGLAGISGAAGRVGMQGLPDDEALLMLQELEGVR